MSLETIRACLLRQARELRAQLAEGIAAVTATYLEYEADRMTEDADEICISRPLRVNGVRYCLISRSGTKTSLASSSRMAAAGFDC
jgi:hypothetical protein